LAFIGSKNDKKGCFKPIFLPKIGEATGEASQKNSLFRIKKHTRRLMSSGVVFGVKWGVFVQINEMLSAFLSHCRLYLSKK